MPKTRPDICLGCIRSRISCSTLTRQELGQKWSGFCCDLSESCPCSEVKTRCPYYLEHTVVGGFKRITRQTIGLDFYRDAFCWYLHGQLHRVDGPAAEYADGTKEWYLHGELHRQDGPAIEYADGTKYWYLHGKQYTEKEHKRLISNAQNQT